MSSNKYVDLKDFRKLSFFNQQKYIQAWIYQCILNLGDRNDLTRKKIFTYSQRIFPQLAINYKGINGNYEMNKATVPQQSDQNYH